MSKPKVKPVPAPPSTLSGKLLDDPTAATFAPALFAQVLAVEQSASHLPGATKADIAVTTAIAGLQAVGQVVPPGRAQTGVALASTIVGLLNAFGLFQRKPK